MQRHVPSDLDFLEDLFVNFEDEDEPCIKSSQVVSPASFAKVTSKQHTLVVKHQYDLSFKLRVALYAREKSNREASTVFRVPRTNVILWRKQVLELEEAVEHSKQSDRSRKRLSGGGRNLIEPLMEDELF
ncbi:hypothetical protein RCL1_007243 [Eukaryota sp. TZLM3-RCL]